MYLYNQLHNAILICYEAPTQTQTPDTTLTRRHQ